MIVHDSCSQTRACFNYHRLSSTVIDYRAPFDRGLRDGVLSAKVVIERTYECTWDIYGIDVQYIQTSLRRSMFL